MPQHCMPFAALKKVEAVLALARDNFSFYEDLINSPNDALISNGLELTHSEVEALVDVITGEKKSKFNIPPVDSELDKMELLRIRWRDVDSSYKCGRQK